MTDYKPIPAEYLRDPDGYKRWRDEQEAEREAGREASLAKVRARMAQRDAERKAELEDLDAKFSERRRAEWATLEADHRRAYLREGGTDAEFDAAWPGIKAALMTERLAERERNAFRVRF